MTTSRRISLLLKTFLVNNIFLRMQQIMIIVTPYFFVRRYHYVTERDSKDYCIPVVEGAELIKCTVGFCARTEGRINMNK